MREDVLVIQVIDVYQNADVIGVAKDWDESLKMIRKYFGKDASYGEVEDVRDSGIEFTIDVTINKSEFNEEINHVTVYSFIPGEI